MADKKRDILEFVEQMNFKQMIPTQFKQKIENNKVKTIYNILQIIAYCKINCNILVN